MPRLRLGLPAGRTSRDGSSRWRFGVPLVFAAAGLLFSTSAGTAHHTNLRSDETAARLDDVVRQTQQRNDARSAELARLRAHVDALSSGLASDE
ncbi:MAG: DUF881 domain-containing protein, partial [Dehalococcoidia bacterium]